MSPSSRPPPSRPCPLSELLLSSQALLWLLRKLTGFSTEEVTRAVRELSQEELDKHEREFQVSGNLKKIKRL